MSNHENPSKNRKSRFSKIGGFGAKLASEKGAEISNRCFSVRVYQNPKKLIFELWPFLGVKSHGEHDRTIGKMIWRRKRVEKAFFLIPNIPFFCDFGQNLVFSHICRK